MGRRQHYWDGECSGEVRSVQYLLLPHSPEAEPPSLLRQPLITIARKTCSHQTQRKRNSRERELAGGGYVQKVLACLIPLNE